MNVNPLNLIDFYKADHRRQYPEGTELVYSNLTARASRVPGVDHIVFFGMQYFLKEYLVRIWNEGFFDLPKDEVVERYKRRMDTSLGPDAIPVEHVAALHDLGFLPVHIKAVPEGTIVPLRVACMTIQNTRPEFFWLTNYFESILSATIWKPITSATIANQYRKEFDKYAKMTGYDKGFVQWQGHDFSFRGMSGIEDACMSGAGHLLSFTGTDTVHAIDFLEEYYGADASAELIGGSVPATEHSVMSMGCQEGEVETIRRLITKVYPKGIVSIVSDTWDFWKVITEYATELKDEIMSREGRLVFRPDSGDPVRIICGYSDDEIHHFEDGWWHAQPVQVTDEHGQYASTTYYKIKKLTLPEIRGAYQCLIDTFGATQNAKGYLELDTHVGLIYGDSITLDRQKEILRRLAAKGIAPSNLVLGIGSFTYEYVTRDTFGMAMKATYGVVDGRAQDIFKRPKTDTGLKNSAKGLLYVGRDEDGNVFMEEGVTPEREAQGLLRTVFIDGLMPVEESLDTIRKRLRKS